MSKEPLSNFDAFLVRMETPTNMAVITGLMIFDQPVEYERLRATGFRTTKWKREKIGDRPTSFCGLSDYLANFLRLD